MADMARKLAAIMFTDIVGYTTLMARDEEAGRRTRDRHETTVRPLVEECSGEWIERTGDETLSTFPSALDAVNCALAIQAKLRQDPELQLRIGIHQGDVTFDAGGVSGGGINLAARIRPLAEPGGICISDDVHESVQGRSDLEFVSLGQYQLKNVDRPVAVYAVARPGAVSVSQRLVARARVRNWRRYAMAGLVLAVVAVIAWRPWELIVGALPPIRSIAVLPLENLSGDPEQEYFADGMTDAIIAEFARIGSLRVISRTSVMQYKKARKPLPDIARELNVQGVVEGSVLRADDRVRITLQLIDARNDQHLWAESYERGLRDVLDLQGEIARAVAREVEAELTPEEQARLRSVRSVDPEAHDYYLRGTLHLAEVTAPDLFKAIEYFEQAVGRDPDHAEAWAGLADAYRTLGWGLGALRPAEAGPKARAAVNRALSLDDSLARARATLGDVLAHYFWLWERAEEELQRAVESSPGDPIVSNRYGLYLAAVGRHEEALRFHQRAVDASPASFHWRNDKALALLYARDYKRAAEEFRQILEVNPGLPFALFNLGIADVELGRNSEAFDVLFAGHRSVGRDERWLRQLKQGYEAAGIRGALRSWLVAESERAKTEYVDDTVLGLVASRLGDADTAFQWLERGYDARSPHLADMVGNHPWLDPIRSDPRFQDLLRRMNYPGAS